MELGGIYKIHLIRGEKSLKGASAVAAEVKLLDQMRF